jgi:hypothetical protein
VLEDKFGQLNEDNMVCAFEYPKIVDASLIQLLRAAQVEILSSRAKCSGSSSVYRLLLCYLTACPGLSCVGAEGRLLQNSSSDVQGVACLNRHWLATPLPTLQPDMDAGSFPSLFSWFQDHGDLAIHPIDAHG